MERLEQGLLWELQSSGMGTWPGWPRAAAWGGEQQKEGV